MRMMKEQVGNNDMNDERMIIKILTVGDPLSENKIKGNRIINMNYY